MIISDKRHPLRNLGKLPDAKNGSVGEGIVGNQDTIKIMTKMAREGSRHPLIRRLATNILNHDRIPSHHYLEEARAIGTFVQKNVRYVKDIAGVETIHSPDMMIRQMSDVGYFSADCDDMALLIASMLLSIGIVPKYRAVRYRAPNGAYNHIYVVVYENNIADTMSPGPTRRLVLDGIVKDRPIGFEIPHASGDEFDL
jgi:hypothetical protein